MVSHPIHSPGAPADKEFVRWLLQGSIWSKSVIPKSQPGKWRLIVDLSSPEAVSVNNGIDRLMCSINDIVESVEGKNPLQWIIRE